MSATASAMVPLGTKAPPFKLYNPCRDTYESLKELQSDIATVIMFICNHCPFVKHIQHELVRVANDYMPKGVAFIAINSNDTERYPEDGPEEMKQVAESMEYPFPYLFDEDQKAAKAYHAECTPDFFIFDKNMQLAYRGQLDEARPGNSKKVSGQDLRQALDLLLEGKTVPEEQNPSMGCNIKWKP